MIPKFRAWDKRFSEFVEDFFVSEDGKIYKKKQKILAMVLLYQERQAIKLSSCNLQA
nr:MAG TPA: YopX protein [Caudoviricetes sp.]